MAFLREAVARVTVPGVAYRRLAGKDEEDGASAARPDGVARVLVVSESGVCRAPLAAAMLVEALAFAGVPAGAVDVDAAAVLDHNEGEGVAESARAAAVAEQLSLPAEDAYAARSFDAASDGDAYDLILAVDAGVAADVLKKICVYDIVERDALSSRVRRLGEFGPRGFMNMSGRAVSIDVDDALYGNRGGEEEVEGVRAAIDSMRAMVDGVAVWLSALELRAAALADEAPEGEEGDGDAKGNTEGQSERSLPAIVRAALGDMPETAWLVPPMLQKGQPGADPSRAMNAAVEAAEASREFDWDSLTA